MKPIETGLVGVGRIAQTEHVPALAAHPGFRLGATASPHHHLEGIPSFPHIQAMLEALPSLEAVSICTPPQIRYEAARYALQKRKHVMLEKPPCASLAQVSVLKALADQQGVTLFATWHSREGAGVEPARNWLIHRRIRRIEVIWKEYWDMAHPDQAWIWQAGGFGVFDPGINALSILTRIVPGALYLTAAQLEVPSNCETPIAATLQMMTEHDALLRAEFDFRHTDSPTWEINVETHEGHLQLSNGGSMLRIDDTVEIDGPFSLEYSGLYARFEQLIREGRSDVDIAPLQLVADAFMLGSRVQVDAVLMSCGTP